LAKTGNSAEEDKKRTKRFISAEIILQKGIYDKIINNSGGWIFLAKIKTTKKKGR